MLLKAHKSLKMKRVLVNKCGDLRSLAVAFYAGMDRQWTLDSGILGQK
jgi:hypothetical protein